MTDKLVCDTPLFDWFEEEVTVADRSLGIRLSAEARFYLSQMLTERGRTHHGVEPPDTLVELFLAASDAPPGTRARLCREAGDRALHVLGYFRESLVRRNVAPSYYADLGAQGYDQAHLVLERFFASSLSDVLDELAKRFRDAVRVVGAVREKVDSRPDPVQRLLVDFDTSPSAITAERLRDLGILVPRGRIPEA